MTLSVTKAVGEVLIDLLQANDVDVVFGIPGVHTVELYRGLANSPIRHVTPRHEQGAGFMADGYARVSGKPGVCLVITGPGLTNIITPMAQARADSVPMLVISGVNGRAQLGHGRGELHELPDQSAMIKTLANYSHTLLEPTYLADVIAHAFGVLGSSRPGPVHIEIPTDVMSAQIEIPELRRANIAKPRAAAAAVAKAAELCANAQRSMILAGGGAKEAASSLGELATRIDAPIITTVNARGILHGHPLCVPASPSLAPVREALMASDLVLAIGTEIGATDYDIYGEGKFPALQSLVRIDIDADQIARGPRADVALLSAAGSACEDLVTAIPSSPCQHDGAKRATSLRNAAIGALGFEQRQEVEIIDTIRTALPGCIIVGDSTRPVYSGNLYCECDRIGGWFNAATGYGALGFAPPAAIGASIAAPGVPVVCLVGDGGIQFTLGELGSSMDENTPVIFLVWNNFGYQTIEQYMTEFAIAPVGVSPSPPDFELLAQAYGLGAQRLSAIDQLPGALAKAAAVGKPALIEIPENIVPTRGS